MLLTGRNKGRSSTVPVVVVLIGEVSAFEELVRLVEGRRAVLLRVGSIPHRVEVEKLQGIRRQRINRLGQTILGVVGLVMFTVTASLRRAIFYSIVGLIETVDRRRTQLMRQPRLQRQQI
jgi:hypothetical protein